LKMNKNQINLISENLYIFELPELANVKAAVQAALDTYAREVMGIAQRLEVTQSWSLTNPPGAGMHGHTHSNSIVSGSLYYTDLPDPPANMVFDRYKHYRQIELAVDDQARNIYNTPYNLVTPKKYDLILFSSDYQHFVEVNRSQKDRHSIAFNTFVRGKIGNLKDVSELNL
ncbi:MAG: hypothetical protein CMK07_08545, partial [Ponticaulis sp.]|nr:hypothetical protein [Ponticaulis sp.]